ncbi:MAG: DNA alkylation repair protein [Anaerolineales bacterium]|nr:DNA alkylation repair protein [Chloroflexota bacterium]MBL6980788.1 DNA alkylation repair protein [Anaerolineales bacterium]
MPAIQPAKLVVQVAELTEHVSEPKIYLKSLHELLDFYADRTLRPGQIIESAPLLKSYQVARPVLRQIERELAKVVNTDSEAALALADALWEQRWVETRLLAISILGRVSPNPPERVTQRAQEWGSKCKEDKIIKALSSTGIARLRTESRDEFIDLIESWLTSGNRPLELVGLRALPALLGIDGFKNLPLVFRWIAPLVREADREIRDDLILTIRILAGLSPKETLFFLRNSLEATSNPQTAKLIRRTLVDFPEDLSSTLRLELRRRRNGNID